MEANHLRIKALRIKCVELSNENPNREVMNALGSLKWLYRDKPGKAQGLIQGNIPDPTKNIQDAKALLEAINDQQPHRAGHYPVVTGCGVHGWRIDVMFQLESDAPAEEFSVSAKTLELAICLAYYQFKTGIRVEVSDD